MEMGMLLAALKVYLRLNVKFHTMESAKPIDSAKKDDLSSSITKCSVAPSGITRLKITSSSKNALIICIAAAEIATKKYFIVRKISFLFIIVCTLFPKTGPKITFILTQNRKRVKHFTKVNFQKGARNKVFEKSSVKNVFGKNVSKKCFFEITAKNVFEKYFRKQLAQQFFEEIAKKVFEKNSKGSRTRHLLAACPLPKCVVQKAHAQSVSKTPPKKSIAKNVTQKCLLKI